MSEPELTPAEETEVSRLLASASGPEPMPAAVAARLDDVLAGLVAERTTHAPDRQDDAVVPLRRRRWPQVLVAAAAVSILGVAAASYVDGLTGSAGDAETSAPAADSADELAPGAGSTDDGGQSQRDADERLPQSLDAPLLRDLGALGYKLPAGSAGPLPAPPARVSSCSTPPLGAGDTAYEVVLGQGDRGVVVLRPLTGSASQADLYPCRTPLFPLASSLVLATR